MLDLAHNLVQSGKASARADLLGDNTWRHVVIQQFARGGYRTMVSARHRRDRHRHGDPVAVASAGRAGKDGV